jgi:hypothetical protein
MKGIT